MTALPSHDSLDSSRAIPFRVEIGDDAAKPFDQLGSFLQARIRVCLNELAVCAGVLTYQRPTAPLFHNPRTVLCVAGWTLVCKVEPGVRAVVLDALKPRRHPPGRSSLDWGLPLWRSSMTREAARGRGM